MGHMSQIRPISFSLGFSEWSWLGIPLINQFCRVTNTLKISVAYNNRYLFSCAWVYRTEVARIGFRYASQVSLFSLDQWLLGTYSSQEGAQEHRANRNMWYLLKSWPRTVTLSLCPHFQSKSFGHTQHHWEDASGGSNCSHSATGGTMLCKYPCMEGREELRTITNLPHSLYLSEPRL